MKFLANENIPNELVFDLRKCGYDILKVYEIKKGMTDFEILNYDLKGERIIVNFDKDFGKLANKENRKTIGVILLRINPKSIN